SVMQNERPDPVTLISVCFTARLSYIKSRSLSVQHGIHSHRPVPLLRFALARPVVICCFMAVV
ncbi:hypothetical protein, partial [Endozoicomonas sp. ONNA2]|uniref:hypothetical protein n=1 Tax=Endozoicomonas sp. ONNA2 TaxID=2828741 RepID=UPI0021473183